MKIHFKIPYYTQWGQRLLVCGTIPELGNGCVDSAVPMMFQAHEDWYLELDIKGKKSSEFRYWYVLYDEKKNSYLEEWGNDRTIHIDPLSTEHYFCFDSWNESGSVDNVFMSSPFQEVLLKQDKDENQFQLPAVYTHLLRVKMPLLLKNERICVVGDCDELGNWTINNPLFLQKADADWWMCALNFANRSGSVNYKYAIYNIENQHLIAFENGADRVLPLIPSKKTIIQKTDGFVRVTNQTWKGAGVGLPVFSIRTRNSFGVGDFVDLKLFVDWASRVGLKLIQVLPLNDTIGTHTDADVLPYAAVSAFALNPLFLNLSAMGKLPDQHPLQQLFYQKQKDLNACELIAFLDVINYKLAYAYELCKLQKDHFLASTDFKNYYADNEHWLVPYAIYCVLRDKYGTSDYRKWDEYAVYDNKMVSAFLDASNEFYDQVITNFFIQYHLHIQLSEAAEYAHSKGVVLKGDIPIGVNRNSVDTWVSPSYFNMDMQAGAPPDMFAVKGQNWELPTYNWEAIRDSGFDWWKKRFAQMSHYFDTFRVDHILGFFRIWQIPASQLEGIMGYLNPSVPVHINEFRERGIWFDYNRFCKPYITDKILYELFGDETSWVKANCLQIEDGWILRLKAEFQSQLKVAEMFEQGTVTERVKWGLFDLISNVLFFEKEDSKGEWFYPRFGMEGVRSFHDLDQYSKDKLREIYVDYFYRRQDSNWYQSGMEKLPALKRATNMLICGEDLGMMTPCVTTVMHELGILSLEVQRAPKTNDIEFFHPDNAPYLSVVTPSTHDMSTIRAWWEEDRGVTQRFFNSQLGHWGEAPFFCEWWICRDIILQHLYSPAMWAIFQMQDLLGISEVLRRENPHDERINVPSNSKHSWRYRLHLNMEDLIENNEFNDELRNFITQSGR